MRHEELAYVLLGAAAVGLLFARTRKIVGAGTMQDTPVSLENVRKGIARGWYSAQLCTVDGRPAVKLSGTANGKPYSDYYPVSQATWNALKADGVQQIGRVCGVGSMWGASPLRFDSSTQYIVTLYRNKRDWKNDVIVDEAQTMLYGKDDLVRFAKTLARGRDYGIIEVYDARYAGSPHVVYNYDRAGRRIDPYAQ